MQQVRWNELSSAQQVLLIAATGAEVALTVAALADLLRRPQAQVRGPKLAWAAVAFIQPAGPPAYLLWGRRRVVGGEGGEI